MYNKIHFCIFTFFIIIVTKIALDDRGNDVSLDKKKYICKVVKSTQHTCARAVKSLRGAGDLQCGLAMGEFARAMTSMRARLYRRRRRGAAIVLYAPNVQ